MLEEDVIESWNSDCSNPVVIIKKPNGEYRFCLDFINVNKITKTDLYPIPIMAEMMDALKFTTRIRIGTNNSVYSTRNSGVQK